MRWKGILILIGGLLAGGLLGFLIYNSGQPPTGSAQTPGRFPLVVGSPVPDFALPMLEGGTQGESQTLSGLKGKPVVVNFWATWCLPCKEEMPLLDAYAEKFAGEMVLLGVNVGEDENQVQPFVDEVEIGFPILLDRDEQTADTYMVRNLPVTLFIDADGVLRAQHLGTLREDTLARYLETIGIKE